MNMERTRAFAEKSIRIRRAFLDSLQRPEEVEVAAFEKCVKRNADTSFGREHGFSKIRDLADFRRQVPIRGYDAMSPWLERVASGEDAVLTAADPIFFARTSGTTGAAKKIPWTAEGIFNWRPMIRHIMWGALIERFPQVVAAPGRVFDIAMDRRPPTMFLGKNVPYQSTAQRPWAGEADWTPPWNDAAWFNPPLDLTEYADRTYYRLRHVIANDVHAAVTLNPSTAIVMAGQLEQFGERLVDELEHGMALGKAVEPNRTRAGELRAILKEKGRLRPKDIWPNLSFVCCWKAASAALYIPQLAELYGPGTDVVPSLNGSSEGQLAVPVDAHPSAGVLAMCENILFEFVPADEMAPNAPTLSFKELEPGATYSVVITQVNGLYRYDIGDTFKVVEYAHGVPRIEFCGRRGSVSSFTGEKLTEAQIVTSTMEAMAKCGLEAVNFTCCPRWGTPPGYVFAIEPKGAWSNAQVDALTREIDERLGENNEEYPGKRSSGRLAPPVVQVLPGGAFERYWTSRVAAGVSPSLVKHLPLQKDDTILASLNANSAS